jgi:hypothetical protein
MRYTNCQSVSETTSTNDVYMGTQEWFWKENLNNDIHQHQQNEQTSIASTHWSHEGQDIS